MAISVFLNGREFKQTVHDTEDQFELLIAENSDVLFGSQTIYIDVKHRIQAGVLGGTIPDGILLDLSDAESPEFYLVEIELEKHDFNSHIFPQITKFFNLLRRSDSRQKLTEQLFQFFKSNTSLREKLKGLIGTREVYKFGRDVLENSQNILVLQRHISSRFSGG